jgi:hypothetical protein
MENNVRIHPAHIDEDERSKLLYRKPTKSIQTVDVPLVTKINNSFALYKVSNTKVGTYRMSQYLATELSDADSAGFRSKSWVCGRSLAGVAVSNPAWGKGISLVDVA